MSNLVRCLMFAAAVLPAMPRAPAAADDAPADASAFEKSVRPILQARCFKCHGGEMQKAELNLSTRVGLLKGGESGEAVVAGKPEESLLFEMVQKRQMPPKGEEPLTAEQIEAIRRWIADGAKIPAAGGAEIEVTQHNVLPILQLRCTVCHGTRVQEAGLDLRTKASMLKGGKSGPAFVPGKPEESLILKRIRAEEMPPRRRVVEVSIKPIEPNEVETLVRWIAAGASESPLGPDVATTAADPLVNDAERQFWAFQPPREQVVPRVAGESTVASAQAKACTPTNAIDAFIVAKLSEHGLSLSDEADKQTLLRRVYFDLVGLPPAPEEADEFLNDTRPDAYERLVDRLLASPRYGERWGRYWLDLAGYADSNGVQHADPIRDHIWRYRDYVIQSFNADKPYDRFLTEQIAGDELADYEHGPVTPEIYDNLVATGFLRLTPDGTSANITNFVPDRLEIVADEINVLSSAVMGLTLRCARCHTHKFDPIPHRDYFRLAAVFKGAYDENDWLKATKKEDARGPWPERLLPNVLPDELAAWTALDKQFNDETAQLRATLKTRTDELTKNILDERLAKLPEALRDDLRKMLDTPADKRDEVQKYLASKFEKELKVSPDDLKQADPEYKKLAEETDAKLKQLDARRRPKPQIHALWDRGEPSPTYILRRGDYTKPGREVGPGVPSVLTDGKTPFVVEPPWPGAKQTGRRLAFARWLTQPKHPLTARVMVNRIWRHHFGAGLVRTLDNFGKTGEPPTHPELLDWLAREFVRSGWSVKHMHRLMVNSATYRQSSQSTDDRERIDPENRLVSRMPLRRLEAETLRDSLLSVAGRLDATPFGPPDDVEAQPSGLVISKATGPAFRRTVYVLQRRTQLLTLLEDFDLPQMSPNCIDRPVSTVAPQALHLLNSAAVHDLAGHFAERVRQSAGDDPARRIETAWRLALGRAPTADELQLATATLAELTQQWQSQTAAGAAAAMPAADQALVNFCHALFNSAEFLIVD